jgi:hypothetical protein
VARAEWSAPSPSTFAVPAWPLATSIGSTSTGAEPGDPRLAVPLLAPVLIANSATSPLSVLLLYRASGEQD